MLYKAYGTNLRVVDRWTAGDKSFANLIDNYLENGLKQFVSLEVVAYASGKAYNELSEGNTRQDAVYEVSCGFHHRALVAAGTDSPTFT